MLDRPRRRLGGFGGLIVIGHAFLEGLDALGEIAHHIGNSALADRGFHWLMVLCALSIFGIVVLIATELVLRSTLAWHQFGFNFFGVWIPL